MTTIQVRVKMSLRTHLPALAARQRCDVTEVCDPAQLAGHGHHASLFGVLLMFGHVETHHHRLLIIFPAKKKKMSFMLCYI